MRQRRHIGSVLQGICLFVGVEIAIPPATAIAQSNPIVIENQQPGSGGWWWTKLADDVNQQIKGYASATSVNQGENINFYVTVNPAQSYTLDIYRIGWYAGLGGRLRLHVGPLDWIQQPACTSDPSTGLLACNWTPSYTLTVPSDWTSGVYVGLLTNAQGFQNYVKFVVRDGRPAAFLYQHGVATDEAYNNYPDDGVTGKSLYDFNSFGPNTLAGEPRAVKVSFDRPFADSGIANFFSWEIQLVRWLERNGYDVTYSTDIDTHVNGGELKNHKAFFSTGHDEYWTKEMYDAAEAARDSGVNLAFFGADAVYTQTRLEPSAGGVANRVMVVYRWTPDPVQGPTTTTEFRSSPVNRPEQTLIGVQYLVTMQPVDYVVTNSSHWAYSGTGFKDGDVVRGIVGYEADVFMPNFPAPDSTNQTLLSRSPTPNTDRNGATIYSSSSIYQAPSGAWVFASGTMSWSWALDDVPGRLSNGRLDARIQRTTANILNAFLNGVPPTITSFTPTAGPAGTVVTMSGSGFTGTTAVSFNGTAASFAVLSDTTLQATVPTGATTGLLSVTNPGGTATSAATFLVAPAITSFTPTSGLSGASVTISGTNFTGATSVAFNGTVATFTVTSDTAIQTTVPAAATTGPLTVTTPGGTATSASPYVVTAPPDFTVGASPSSQTVVAGASTSYTVAVTPINGFTGQVAFTASGLPAGATGSFTPNPATTSATLSVTTSTSTPIGTSTLRITGTSGTLTHTTTVDLTVTRVIYDNAVSSGFRWQATSVTTPSFVVGSGANRAAMIMVIMTDNTATGVTASLGGVSGTLIPGTDSGTTATVRTLIFCVANPPAGAQTATASWTNTVNGAADVGVITVSGADQATPCTNGTFLAGNSRPVTTSVTIASTTGDLTASVACTNDVWVAPYTNQALKWGLDSGQGGADIGPGTGTTTHAWTDQWPLNAHAVSGANFKAVAGADFTLSASPSSGTVTAGTSTSYPVTINPTGGFADPVSLSVTGLPAGANSSFAPNPTTTSSALSVTTSTSTPAGTYTVTITGTIGTLTHTTTVTLVVNDFTLGASPPNQTVMAGASTSYGVMMTPLNGFTGAVTLSASGLPAGASGSFTPNPTTTSSTFSVTTSTTTPAGTFTVTITGVSGSLTRTTTVMLSVMRGTVAFDNSVSSGFRWQVTAVTTPSFVVGSGADRAAMIMVIMTNNAAAGVTASLGGVSGTLIPGTDSGTTATVRTLIFCVANPPAGAQTATASWTNTVNGADVGVITVSGADQATPCTNGTFLAGNSRPVTTPVTIASTAGDLTASVAYTNDAWAAPYTNQTLKWGLDSGQGGADIGPGTGTTTHAWTDQWPLNAHAVSGANFKASTAAEFTLTASPSSRTVTAGTSASYGITMTPLNGFTGAVTLSASGLPAGAGGSFAPNPATTSSTLSVTTSASTPAGTYPITITGVSGSLTRTTTVTLIVMHATVAFDNAVSSGFRWQATTVTTPSFVIGSGANRAAMIMVIMTNNAATGVTASLGGVSGTLIPGTDSGTTATVRTLIFCVANPPAGAQTATASWTNTVNGAADVGVITVSGADQATPCTNGTFLAGNSRPVTTSVTIASTTGDLTASVACTNDVWVAPYTNQALKWGLDSGQGGADIGPGTGTTTHAWTDRWPLNAHAVSGANFKAAP